MSKDKSSTKQTETKTLTIPQYATLIGTSKQNIYQKVKSGNLPVKKVNGKMFIEVNGDNQIINPIINTEINPSLDNQFTVKENELKLKLKHQRSKNRRKTKEIKEQKNRIEKLEKRITKLEKKIDSKDDYIGKIMNSIVPLLSKKEEEDYIEADVIHKKKKKRKNKK